MISAELTGRIEVEITTKWRIRWCRVFRSVQASEHLEAARAFVPSLVFHPRSRSTGLFSLSSRACFSAPTRSSLESACLMHMLAVPLGLGWTDGCLRCQGLSDRCYAQAETQSVLSSHINFMYRYVTQISQPSQLRSCLSR